MLKSIYKWHRYISLIIALPVVMWAISGFMHPIMTSFRPAMATQFLMPRPIDTSKLAVTLQQALRQNKIDTLQQFRIVRIDTHYFYQVVVNTGKPALYLSATTGEHLHNGDALYAQYLAKQFLQGERITNSEVVPTTTTDANCCDAATACVLYDTVGASVASVDYTTTYTDEYKAINRLLPVYKVAFKRKDGIRLYVQTHTDKFAYAVDDRRAMFDSFFTNFHTWAWLDFLGEARYWIEVVLMLLALATTIMGLYIFFKTKSKHVLGSTLSRARRNHRYTSVAISIFTVMFTFSGAIHAFEKVRVPEGNSKLITGRFFTDSIVLDWQQLKQVVVKPISNVQLVQIEGVNYWQVFTASAKPTKPQRKDAMKDKVVPTPNAVYVHTNTYQILPQGELVYAKYLAKYYSMQPVDKITGVDTITKFAGEYGFINKRLPVFKVKYAHNNAERYYVETSTGALAAIINDIDLVDGYSFSILHKHHFLDAGGKALRDFSTMFWAAAQVAMVAIGLWYWQKKYFKK